MIPYFPQPTLELGPITIHVFGALVGCAAIVGVTILHGGLSSGPIWWIG